MSEKTKVLKTKLKTIITAILVIVFTFYAGYFFEAWTGFPKGVDLYSRMTRIKFILDFFPHVNWQYHWANGLPTFTTEGPFFYYLGAILVKLTSISIEQAMVVLGMVTFLCLGLGIWGYVSSLSGSRVAGLAAAFLVLSSFSTWEWLVQGGIYPRIFSVGLMALVLWFFSVLEKKEGSHLASRPLIVLTILTLTALITSHILIGLFTFAAIFLHLLFSSLSFKQKFRLGAKVLGGSVGLAGFFYLPFLASLPNSSSRFIGVISPVLPMVLRSLWDYAGLGPIVLPVFLFLLLFSGRQKMIKPSLIMLLFFIFYGFIGHTGLSGRYYYINGFIPWSAALFLTFFAAIISGLLLATWFNDKSVKKKIIGWVLVLAVFFGAIIVVPFSVKEQKAGQKEFNRPFIYDSSVPSSWVRITQEMGVFPNNEFQFRFAPFDALEAVWFNYVYKTPQERDYYGQGILHPDWRYWFEQALWNPEFKKEETKMALDWFGIRWFTEGITNLGPMNRPIEEVLKEYPSRYFNQSDYQFIQSGFIDWFLLLRFENPNPSPIFSATNAAPVLVIGNEAGQNILFRDLSLLNLNSQKIIPLLGKKNVDDYRLEELKHFPLVVLYNYQYRQKGQAFKLLADYVRAGGNLIWETTDSPDADGLLPEPGPVTKLKKQEVKKTWDLTTTDSPLTSDLALSSFSPLVYNDGVWQISQAAENDFRPGVKGILGKNGQWLAVSRDYGKGKIVWTGFNFPYHASMEKNGQEAQLLANILSWMGIGEEKEKLNFKAEFINPEKRVIATEQPAKGVLFKENFYPKWHAWLEDGSKQTIFYAGPGMMYVLLDSDKPVKLIFEYRRTWVEILGILVSCFVLLNLIIYLVKGKTLMLSSFLNRLGNWWEKEE